MREKRETSASRERSIRHTERLHITLLKPSSWNELLATLRRVIKPSNTQHFNLSSIKHEIRYFHVVVLQWRQRNVQKKTWCTCRAAVCQAKPIAFLLSSLPCYCMVTSVAEPLVHVYPAPLIERFLCTRITWGRKAGALSFTASTREKLKVCNSYATCAKYFKARVITFTFKVKRITNTLLI